jgi:hypothetical protein
MLARSPRCFGHALALATLVYTTPGVSAPAAVFAGAAELLPWERQVLSSGGRVERPLSFSPGKGSYVGGIAYQVVHRSPAEVLSALSEVRRLAEMLPRTRSARLVSSEPGRARIELEQGQPPFLATYTIVLERAGDNDELRFWLDPAAPHDIRDVFGFFRVRPLGAGDSLLTIGAAVDLGPGLFTGLFEAKVQAVVLRSVTGIRDFMEPGRMALVGY